LNLEAFCYIGLLRFPEELEPALALLPDGQRAEAAKLLEAVKAAPKAELLQRWGQLRRDEYAALCRSTRELTGIRLEELSPYLRDWCVSWLVDRNG